MYRNEMNEGLCDIHPELRHYSQKEQMEILMNSQGIKVFGKCLCKSIELRQSLLYK